MKPEKRRQWKIAGALFLIFTIALGPFAFAETNVTDAVKLIKSRISYDQEGKASYLNVALQNASENTILIAPVKIIIESISSPDVTVENPDGTVSGKPYFEYGAGELFPGQMTESKKWRFSNQKRKRFLYTVSIKAEGTRGYDSDNDGQPDSSDACPNDPNKTAPGACGCGNPETDTDSDGTPNCNDNCPNDAGKTDPGTCGCGVADTDSDADGTPNCNDNCPNDAGKTDPGTCGCGVSDADSDGDGVLNCNDGCPNNAGKTAPGVCGCGMADADADGDGVLNCKDGCPSDSAKTAPGTCGCGVPDTADDDDGDGTVNCLDRCPTDANKTAPGSCGCGNLETDTDGDGTPNCVDGCPNDAGKTAAGDCGCGTPDTDTDADGVADCNDNCPNTPAGVPVEADGCSAISISGHVRSAGSRVASAQVKVGSDSISTDGNGDFSAQVGEDDILSGTGGQVFPVEVTADGYAPGYAKVPYDSGKSDYQIEIILVPVSQKITGSDDVTAGVDILKGNEKVGELTIPDSAFPAGVTQITGDISYIDPTTTDLDAFPGGDFLARRQGGDTVTLETLGLMSFDLEDEAGNPITTLSGNADLCMKVPVGLTVSVGETIPLWWYNPADGLWHEDGYGTVENRGADGLWMCGTVSHFTWWNYDRPVETHSCFKFSIVKESDGTPADLNWYAEGITFPGGAPERPCDCDGNDPNPCPDQKISSLTVKKTTDPANPEKIRVYTNHNGSRHYLKDDGDGTYSLTTSKVSAAVFETPAAQGSCFFNENVENCVPLDGDDGILPLGGINFAPDIESFSVPNQTDPEGSIALSAQISDPDGDSISLNWSWTCGTIQNANPSNGVTSASPVSATAEFIAPDAVGFCNITLTAEDIAGNVSEASAWVKVGNILGTLRGTLYGTDAQPMAGVQVKLQEGYDGTEDYSRIVTTDADGVYTFDDVPCSNMKSGTYCYGFNGRLIVDLNVGGTVWNSENYVWFSCCGTVCDTGEPGCGESVQDIYSPTLWGTLQGTAYDESGNPAQIASEVKLYSYGQREGSFQTAVPVSVNGIYGPVSVPMGAEVFFDTSSPNTETGIRVMYKDEIVNFDIGPGALGTIEGYVYDNNGDPVAGATVQCYPSNTTTNADGYYSLSNILTGRQYVYSSGYGSEEGYLYTRGATQRIDINGSGCIVTGTLYDWTGQPEPDTEIEMQINWDWDDIKTTTTDADGEFIFSDLPTGSVSFSVGSSSGFVSESGSTLRIDTQTSPPYAGYDNP